MSDAAASAPASPANFQSMLRGNLAAAAPAPAAPATPATLAPAAQPATALAVPTQEVAPGLEQSPANDNAQALEQQAGEQADPWAEQVHGLTARELVDAAKAGELPESVLQNLKVTVKINGREQQVSLREAANGYMRISDHTQKTQDLARGFDELDRRNGQIRQLFDGWDKPETGAFARTVEEQGLVPQAQALVTRNWGTAEKPNPQGMLDDMRRLGHWETFKAAALEYAVQDTYESKLPPQVRAEVERRREDMWKRQLAAEQSESAIKRAEAKRKRDELLAQRRQQPNQQQQHAQLSQQVSGLRNSELLRMGVLNQNSAPQYVEAVNQRFEAAMGQLVQIASRERQRNPNAELEPLESLVAKAAQIVAEHIGEAPRAPTQAQAAPQPNGLPARPGGAPTTNGAGVHGPMSPRQFEQKLRGGGR